MGNCTCVGVVGVKRFGGYRYRLREEVVWWVDALRG